MQNHIHSANRYDTKINHARKSTETRWSKSWVTVQNQHKSACSSGYILLFRASKAMGNAVCLDRFAPCGPREGHKFLAPMSRCRLGIPWWSLFGTMWNGPHMVSSWDDDFLFGLPMITHISLTLKCGASYFLESTSTTEDLKWDLWTEECKRSLLRFWPFVWAKQALGRMAYAGTGVVDVWFRKFSRTCENLNKNSFQFLCCFLDCSAAFSMPMFRTCHWSARDADSNSQCLLFSSIGLTSFWKVP